MGVSFNPDELDETFQKNSKYELNPAKAAREFRKLSERIDILNSSTLISLLIKYEETIARIFKYIIKKYPSAYLEKKTLSYSEIIKMNSNIDSVKEVLLEREIDEIMRMPISDWYKLLKEKHNVHFENLNDFFPEFKEIYYRRNIIVHNSGKVNISYLNGVDEKQRKMIKQGEKIPYLIAQLEEELDYKLPGKKMVILQMLKQTYE